MREVVQYKWNISLVLARMYSISKANNKYQRGCAVYAKHIFSISEDV